MDWQRRYAMNEDEFTKAMGYYCNVGNHYVNKEPVCDTEGCEWIGYPEAELLLGDVGGNIEGIGNNDHSPLCQFACNDHRYIKCERCGEVTNPSYFRGTKLKKCRDCRRALGER